MLTVINAIELSAEYLKTKNVESPRLNAEILLSDILVCDRMQLYLRFDQPLKEEEIIKYREFIRRRGLREPLQYIIGKVDFYNLEFEVNNHVLIPRPETELLVECIITNNEKNQKLNILEIGSGSGNISISLAKNLPNSIIKGIDISADAVKLAKTNALKNNINGRLDFEVTDYFEFSRNKEHKYDIIVSNPPYVSKEDYSQLEKELLDYEPKIALTDDSDGLSFYREIIKNSSSFLNKNGKIYFEIGMNQAKAVHKMLDEHKFTNIEIVKDYADIDRIITGTLL